MSKEEFMARYYKERKEKELKRKLDLEICTSRQCENAWRNLRGRYRQGQI